MLFRLFNGLSDPCCGECAENLYLVVCDDDDARLTVEVSFSQRSIRGNGFGPGGEVLMWSGSVTTAGKLFLSLHWHRPRVAGGQLSVQVSQRVLPR